MSTKIALKLSFTRRWKTCQMLRCGEGRGRMNTIRTIKCSHWCLLCPVSGAGGGGQRLHWLRLWHHNQCHHTHQPSLNTRLGWMCRVPTFKIYLGEALKKKQPKSLQSSKSRHDGWWACCSIGSKAKEYHSEVWFWKDRQKIKQKLVILELLLGQKFQHFL